MGVGRSKTATLKMSPRLLCKCKRKLLAGRQCLAHTMIVIVIKNRRIVMIVIHSSSCSFNNNNQEGA